MAALVSLGDSPLPIAEDNPISLESLAEETVVEVVAPKTSYVKMFIAGITVFLGNIGYFSMAGVFTSLNAEIGFVSFGILWLTFMLSQLFVAAPMVKVVGPRITVLMGNLCSTVFILMNFYQSWPTLVIAGFAEGLASALRWSGLLRSVVTTAEELAKAKNKSPERYISQFNGILFLCFFASSLIGNVFSTTFLSPAGFLDFSESPFDQNLTNFTNYTTYKMCIEKSDPFTVPLWSYYSLVTVAFVLTFSSILTTIGLGNSNIRGLCKGSHTYCNTCISTGTGLVHKMKEVKYIESFKQFVTMHYKPVAVSLFRVRHMTVMLLPLFNGFSEVFYYGVFSRHFISECFGVGIVGLAVLAWGIGSSMSSLVAGKVSIHSSRTGVAIATASLQAGMILFMLFWEREPSYVMVFLTSLGSEIVDGVWTTLPIIYIGVVAKASEKSAAFAIVYACFALGGAISFFVSGYIAVDVNLWIHLSLLIVSVVVYIIGENVFSPSKCCKNLRDKSDDVEDVNDVEQDVNSFTIIVNFDDSQSDSETPTGQILTFGNKDLWDDNMIVNKVCVDTSATIH